MFQENGIGDAGFEALIRIFPFTPYLHELDVSRNVLSSKVDSDSFFFSVVVVVVAVVLSCLFFPVKWSLFHEFPRLFAPFLFFTSRYFLLSFSYS